MKTLILSLLLCGWIWPMSMVPALAKDPEQGFFDQTFGDFPEELATASGQGKTGILLVFEMEGCPFCRFMRTRVFNQVVTV